MSHEPHTVPCRDSTIGRTQTTTVRLGEDGRVVVILPRPAGTFDWRELDELIRVLQLVRDEMPGEQR